MISEIIELKIKQALPNSSVTVVDFSKDHEGHHAPGAHVAVTVIDSSFEGLSLAEQHKKIYSILDKELKSEEIHALRIRTRTHGE